MRVFLLTGTILLAGCTFVQLSDAGAGVAQLGSGDVANCESKGVVSTQTRAKVVISRSEEAVREELTVMARNEAAKLGANAIVPIAQPEDGAQSFRAFLCN
jgi:hypothetical protein